MFIRRTQTRTTEEGEHYYSYRLVDTYRVGDQVRQRTLLNLGSGFAVAQEQWSALTQRIEDLILGRRDVLLPFPPEVEREAQNIAASLLRKYSGSDLLLSPVKREPDPQTDSVAIGNRDQDRAGRTWHNVDCDSLELMNSRSVGGEAVALSALLQVRPSPCTTGGSNERRTQMLPPAFTACAVIRPNGMQSNCGAPIPC